MAIKNRLAKLEQRRSSLDNVDVKALTDEQLYHMLQESISRELAFIANHYPKDKELREYCQQRILLETGQDCRDWTVKRVLDEWVKLIEAES